MSRRECWGALGDWANGREAFSENAGSVLLTMILT